jgi:hypothetical protein
MQVWRKCTSDLHFVHPICCCCVGTLCEKVSLQEKKEGVRGEEKRGKERRREKKKKKKKKKKKLRKGKS